MKGTFSFPTGGFGKNVIIFGAELSSSVHVGNKRKDVLILVEGLRQGLDDTTLTTRKVFCKSYSRINFNFKHDNTFSLSLHYNRGNYCYLFVIY